MALLTGEPDTLRAQLVRSAVAGVACAAVEWTLFLIAHHGGMATVAATLTAAVAAILVNYLLSIWWVFWTRNVGRQWLELKIFLLIGGSGLLVNAGAMALLVDRWLLPPLAGKILASGLVVAWAFANKKLWLFADRHRPPMVAEPETACPLPTSPR